MTKRNKYIIDEEEIFNQELAKLPESNDTDKILRTLEYMEDKAEITDGNQKARECCAIENIILRHKDDERVLSKCFDTLITLNTEGSTIYRVGEDFDDLWDQVCYDLMRLGKEVPELKIRAGKCAHTIAIFHDYPDTDVDMDVVNFQIEAAWRDHKKVKCHERDEAKKETEKEIADYEERRKKRDRTTLDEVVDARLADAKLTAR